jgi:molecular chaperone GrpE (heat shock protein)
MVDRVDNYRGTTNEELLKQLAVAEACREFWYRAYVRASTYAIDQIDNAISMARDEITEQHGECAGPLKKMQEKIDRILRQMFLTDGRTGLHAILPTAVPADGDSAKVAAVVPPTRSEGPTVVDIFADKGGTT